MKLCSPILAACGIAILVVAVGPAGAAVDKTALRNWGMETYNQIDSTLRVPGTALYAETANLDGSRSGGAYGRAFCWSEATTFRMLDTLTRIDPVTFTPKLRAFSDQFFGSYWTSIGGIGGYSALAGPGERYYDDNAHVVIALVQAYNVTRDPLYLERAKQAQAFVMSGEDNAGGGGIYWREGSTSGKDHISTLQGASGAAMLYRATGDPAYLNDATRLLTWANTHLQESDGLYLQHYDITSGTASDVPLINSAGIAISLNLELYQATTRRSYLIEAERIATRTLTRYFNIATGRINDPGYWAFELSDALDEMTRVGGNPYWREHLDIALHWLHDNKRDPNAHYGVLWGGSALQTDVLPSWSLNDQASVAQAYLNTSINPEPGGAVLCTSAAVLGLRRNRRKRNH